MNIVQTETMMAGSVLRQRNLVMPMRHPSHPMKTWGHTRPMMQELLMEGHDESKAKEDAFAQILPAFRKELGDVHMDNLTWMTVIWKFSKASLKLL